MPRRESYEKVSGSAVYTDDMVLPGMLYGAVLGSDYAHARIKSYDTKAAKALKGVKAVITAADFDMQRCGMLIKDEHPLARDKVRYIGEPVAAVAAIDMATANLAMQLIEIEYEELDAVFDAEEAMLENAPILHEERDSYDGIVASPGLHNVASYTRCQEGELDVWETCDVIVEGVYETPAQEHMYIEPCSTIADIDPMGKVTVWSSQQSVFIPRQLTAEALGIPMTKLRFITPQVGGAFGGKCGVTNQPVTVALALAANAPVKLTYTRSDDMIMNKSRHPSRIYMRTGADSSGKLIAREAKIYFNTGAYADEGPLIGSVATFFSRGPYKIKNMNVETWCVYTNRTKAGAFRGFGVPQATFAGESQIDELAEKLNMDPFDLRMKNMVATDDKWLGGQNIDHGTLPGCLKAVYEASNLRERPKQQKLDNNKWRGIGVSTSAHVSAVLSASAVVKLNEDGTITINTGAVDIGEGADTILSQMAAETLGLHPDDITYTCTDSDTSPYNYQTAGSRTTYVVGTSVTQASVQVRNQIYKHASEMLESAESDLEILPGSFVGVKGSPDARIPFSAVAGRALNQVGGPIVGMHSWLYHNTPFDKETAMIEGFALDGGGVFCFAAQVAVVDVDKDTGKVEVVEFWSAHDVGCAINPKSVEGQIFGGVVQGLGYALFEELVWIDGQISNPSMMDYKVPGMNDVPYDIHAIILETQEKTGPFGARGVGEIPLNGVAPAICNAIASATGARVRTIPATSERVLQEILKLE
ncbi:MAG: xanthine dehydrogenase family protein molybdopterin-binding subunit [Gammaproteobacteria bacterium]|nr:xanthine dehydrogenase family protein molybdopterin-binding subunit [Gammaproteobacteria bacterium]